MKVKKMLCAALLILLVAAGLTAYEGDFYGDWVNVDPDTRGITRFGIVPSGSPGIAVVHAFGSCSPTDCDWGQEKLILYGASVVDKNYQFATAIYYKGYAQTIITMEYRDDGRIFLDYYTQFLDDSGRENYHAYDIYKKKSQEEKCPDLIVDKIYDPEWDANQKISRIKAVIVNIGNVKAGASIAQLIDPSTLDPSSGNPYDAYAKVPELAPGESYTVEFTLPYWVFNPDATLRVTADYKDQVSECDEKNNTALYDVIG
ncbi:MAG: hypothetical protein JXB88_16990 [Spirochaetales bacterium]|nr:hypothetical protein [Spirochaetales bacterium]